MSAIQRLALGVTASLLGLGPTAARAELRPVRITDFFAAPGQPVRLTWTTSEPVEKTDLAYRVTDYRAEPVTEGKVSADATGRIRVQLELEPGFYEIAFPAADQRFGIVKSARRQDPPDPFFCIDSALSWLERREDVREGLAAALRACGIDLSRERLRWGAVHPGPERWDWQTDTRYEELRQVYARHGVKILEMFHDAPRWMGTTDENVYPTDLAAAAGSWTRIAEHWQATWAALEIWNEPDIFFGRNLPADQYVTLVKAISYAVGRQAPDLPLVGGVLTDHCPDVYRQACARNGMLDLIDAVSFHTYLRADTIEDMVQTYRTWLEASGKASLPLWITECGRPWSRGPDRPPTDQDGVSGLDITAKAVEARACGVARYFAFVYPYYEERSNNFGMMGKEVTPLRSMAAYVQAANVLARTSYVGDLPCDDPAVKRARVFRRAERAVIVLYTGRVDPTTSVRVNLAAGARIEGIDGRRLTPSTPNTVPVPDGLSYVLTNFAEIEPAVQRDTTAARLHAVSRQPAPSRPDAAPIVLQHRIDHAKTSATTGGYLVTADEARRLHVRVRAFNLASPAAVVDLELTDTVAGRSTVLERARELALPPTGYADVAWEVDLSGQRGPERAHTLAVTAVNRSLPHVAPLTLDVVVEQRLDDHLAAYDGNTPLPVSPLDRWEPSINHGGEMKMAITPERSWRLQATFAGGDRWVYPKLRLPETVNLAQSRGFLIRARCPRPADPRLMVWEQDGSGYYTKQAMIPPDDRWHVAAVLFRDLSPLPSHPDENGKLDLAGSRTISIGLNSRADDSLLEVSHLYLVGKKPNR